MGFRYLTNSVREIKEPKDIKGLKVRTMENPIHLANWRLLGANPTPMPVSEVFYSPQAESHRRTGKPGRRDLRLEVL